MSQERPACPPQQKRRSRPERAPHVPREHRWMSSERPPSVPAAADRWRCRLFSARHATRAAAGVGDPPTGRPGMSRAGRGNTPSPEDDPQPFTRNPQPLTPNPQPLTPRRALCAACGTNQVRTSATTCSCAGGFDNIGTTAAPNCVAGARRYPCAVRHGRGRARAPRVPPAASWHIASPVDRAHSCS